MVLGMVVQNLPDTGIRPSDLPDRRLAVLEEVVQDNHPDLWALHRSGKLSSGEDDDGRDGGVSDALVQDLLADETRCAGDHDLHGWFRLGTEQNGNLIQSCEMRTVT